MYVGSILAIGTSMFSKTSCPSTTLNLRLNANLGLTVVLWVLARY